MFDDFKESQFVAYSLLTNAIRNNKMSHAYLIDGNNNEYAFDFVMSLVKMIVCDDHYSDYSKCDKCNRCKRIDDGNYTEVKIIESDTMMIKKEQLLELQNEFSKKGIEGNRRIYVIKDCDKMNKQASNSLLKFLEEPEDGIIAILFTNHINNVLSTIISRCQIIKLVKERISNQDNAITNLAYACCNNKKDIQLFVNDAINKKKIDDILNFIVYYEENELDTMLYLKNMWHVNFINREDNMVAILLMINFYYDVLKFKYKIDDYFFKDYLNYVEKIANMNKVDKVINKINVCVSARDKLKYNLNVNLLIDDMVIRLGE